MTKSRFTLILVIALLGMAGSVAAHHSGSVFNTDVLLAVEGNISRFRWGNPHVYIYVEARDASGELVEWEIETDATPILTRSGWSADTLQPGDPVVARINPVHDTSRTHARLRSLTKEDGSIWSARSSFAGSTSDLEGGARAESIAGVWATPLSTNAFIWSLRNTLRKLNARGLELQASYDIATESPAGHCIAYPSPGFLAVPYLNEIEVLEDRVTITGELYNTIRTIYTDGREIPEEGELTNQGYSVGRWMNGELVVETALLEAHRSSMIDGSPAGTQRRVFERFHLSEDRTRLLIDFRVEDPEYLAEPFSATAEWVYMPELELIGIDCDPEVSRRAWEQ